MPSIIDLVISGGQTGADIAGLVAAKAYGIKTSGFAPRGFVTTDGPNPSLGSVYGLIETQHGYAKRTKMNVQGSSLTIIVASNINSAGTKLTINEAKKHGKPYVLATYSPEVELHDWTCESSLKQAIDILSSICYNNENESVIVNIAGNSSLTCPSSYKFTHYFCSRLFEITNGKDI